MTESDKTTPQREQTNKVESGFHAPEALVSGILLGTVGLGLVALLIKASTVEWTWAYWGSSDGTFDRSAIFRNFGLLGIALIGFPLAIWRSWTAHVQARAANKQTQLSEQGLIIDRYQKGAQMLDSSELSVRIAGIYALRELAMSAPGEMYFLVLDILCTFVREKSKEREPEIRWTKSKAYEIEYGTFPADLQSAITACNVVRESQKSFMIEEQRKWRLDLRGANLSGAKLGNFYLSGADLVGANLTGALLFGVDLSNAILAKANLSKTRLTGANLSRAFLYQANLSRTHLKDANLYRTVLDEACLTNANLEEAFLNGATLNLADLSNTNLQGASMIGVKARNSNLSKCLLKYANFAHANLIMVDFTGSLLMGANMSQAELRGTNLTGTYLTGVITDDKTDVEGTWAYSDAQPENMPEKFALQVAYRNSEEKWLDFVERMKLERPISQWNEFE